MNLKEILKDWRDTDIAAHLIATELGLVDKKWSFQADTKWIYWSNNALGNTLYDFIFNLVSIGILERYDEDDNDRVRWNPNFVDTWGVSDDTPVEEQIDRIYIKIDTMLRNGEFEKVDHILKYIIPGTLTTDELLSYLAITLAARHKLKNRKAFFERVKAYLLLDCGNGHKVEELLRGLG